MLQFLKRCNPNIAPHSSYSFLLNHNCANNQHWIIKRTQTKIHSELTCWKLPKLDNMLPPIHALYLVSTEFLLAMTLYLHDAGSNSPSSMERRWSSVGKREAPPVTIILEESSLRKSTSNISLRDLWISFWRGSMFPEVFPSVVEFCMKDGRVSENSNS